MQQAVWLHMLFGFYMFSNSQIFTYSTKVPYVEELKKQLANNGGGIVTSFLDKTLGNYLSSARIFQPHAITYLIGIILYTVLQLVAYLFISMCGNQKCPGFCCCCLTRSSENKGLLTTFSNDIYSDMSIEDLKNEYNKTKIEVQDFKLMIDKGLAIGTDAQDMQMFLKKQETKLKLMKQILTQKMLQAGIQPASNDTLSNFDQLFNQKKNDASHRIKALYSYDIKDNHTF